MVNVQETHKRPQLQVPEPLSNSPGLTPGPLQNNQIPLTDPIWLTNLLSFTMWLNRYNHHCSQDGLFFHTKPN